MKSVKFFAFAVLAGFVAISTGCAAVQQHSNAVNEKHKGDAEFNYMKSSWHYTDTDNPYAHPTQSN